MGDVTINLNRKISENRFSKLCVDHVSGPRANGADAETGQSVDKNGEKHKVTSSFLGQKQPRSIAQFVETLLPCFGHTLRLLLQTIGHLWLVHLFAVFLSEFKIILFIIVLSTVDSRLSARGLTALRLNRGNLFLKKKFYFP
jgi:hypothetical protein